MLLLFLYMSSGTTVIRTATLNPAVKAIIDAQTRQEAAVAAKKQFLGIAKLAASERPTDLPLSPEALATTMPDPIKTWLSDWESHELSGRGATPEEMRTLRQMLIEEDISAVGFCQLVRTIDFLDGHNTILPIYRLAVDRGVAALATLTPPDDSANPLLAAMWPLHEIFNDMQVWDVDRELLESLKRWEIRGSPHSQMVGFKYAELLYDSGAYDEAVAAYEDLQKERAAATEQSQGVNRPLDWDMALALSGARRYSEAAEHFTAAATQRTEYARAAAESVPIMLYRAGKQAAAIARFKQVVSKFRLSATEIDTLAQQMQGD
jgi:hypothetical protein